MIYLVRHGESVGNLDLKNYQKIADHAFELTDLGKQQAHNAAVLIEQHIWSQEDYNPVYQLWTSSFKRARDTADIIQDYLLSKNYHCEKRTDSPLIIEKQYGLYNEIAGQGEDRFEKFFPDYNREYLRCHEYDGRFFARPPGGESDFDVYVRAEMFWEKLLRKDPQLKTNHIIVCHGTTMRILAAVIMEKEYEWFQRFKIPDNGSVICPFQGQLAGIRTYQGLFVGYNIIPFHE